MDCQQVEASNIIVSPLSIHVMVVDDDTASLTLVSNLLKTLNYQVALFNDPIFALCTLRGRKHSFDLIMTALYMSKMDGFELTRRVNVEFKLPVIIVTGISILKAVLSTDSRESVMLRAIEVGVALYLLKPFSPNDLKNIWQFVITAKSRSIPNPNLLIEESRSHGPVEFRAVEPHSVLSSSNKVVQERKKKKDSKGKGGNEEKAKDKMEITPAKKKAKVTWTDFLQYRFLNAVHYIGLDRAVPKKILEVMNVPFLTRENVASHLQKYRIFLRKVAERCMLASDKTTEEIIWSKFLSRHASLVLEKIEQKRAFSFNSSQNFSNPNITGNQTLNPSNRNTRRFTHGQLSFAKNLSPYGLRPTASFVYGRVGTLPLNQNNVRALNEPQFQNLSPYGHSSMGSSLNNNYNPGFSVGVGGDIPGAQMGVSNGVDGNCGGLNAMGVGNFQRDEFGQYGVGVGVGGDNNSYNWGLMCNNNNGVNFGGEFHSTIGSSSYAPNNEVGGQEDSGLLLELENFSENPIPNQEAGNGGFMTEQSNQVQYNNNMNADEEADPFAADLQVLEEFLASLLKIDYPAEG